MEVFMMIFSIVEPLIAKLIESTVVPMLKRKAYEKLHSFATDMVEDLVNLKAKAANSDNPVKKLAYEEGIKLGSATLRGVGNMLIQASDELDK